MRRTPRNAERERAKLRPGYAALDRVPRRTDGEASSVAAQNLLPGAKMTKPDTFCADLTYLPEAIHGFTKEQRWCCWNWVPRINPDKTIIWTKPPFQPNGQHAKSNDPSTWCRFPQALDGVLIGKFDGLGYMLSGTQVAAVDLDKCRDAATGALEQWASDIVA